MVADITRRETSTDCGVGGLGISRHSPVLSYVRYAPPGGLGLPVSLLDVR